MALKDKLNEAAFNGVNYDDMTEVLDDIDEALEGGGGGGLTLYGPYIFSMSADVSPENGWYSIYLDGPINIDDIKYTMDGADPETRFIFHGINNGTKHALISFNPPYIESGYYDFPEVSLIATDSSDVEEGTVFLEYYATKELPLAESEGE